MVGVQGWFAGQLRLAITPSTRWAEWAGARHCCVCSRSSLSEYLSDVLLLTCSFVVLTSHILDCSHLCGVSFLFLRAPTLRGESLRAPGLMSRRKSADETKTSSKPFDAEEL